MCRVFSRGVNKEIKTLKELKEMELDEILFLQVKQTAEGRYFEHYVVFHFFARLQQILNVLYI